MIFYTSKKLLRELRLLHPQKYLNKIGGNMLTNLYSSTHLLYSGAYTGGGRWGNSPEISRGALPPPGFLEFVRNYH